MPTPRRVVELTYRFEGRNRYRSRRSGALPIRGPHTTGREAAMDWHEKYGREALTFDDVLLVPA
ncbi:MAG: hypothetical protein PVF04_03705, partial [Anaerolineae bacterium]